MVKGSVTDRYVVDLKSRRSGHLLHFYQFRQLIMLVKINVPTIGIAEGGTTDKMTTAILNTANTQPIRGVGVGGAIRRAGGTDITVGRNLTTRYITKPLDQLSIWQPAF